MSYTKLDMSVLYVEDDLSVLSSVEEFLSFKVERYYLAKNGKEGLELYIKHKPDLVVTDIKMPLMNGIEMSDEIKRINPQTPIIITTAYQDSELLLSATHIGVNNFLIKPINLEKLDNLITKYCDELHNRLK